MAVVVGGLMTMTGEMDGLTGGVYCALTGSESEQLSGYVSHESPNNHEG